MALTIKEQQELERFHQALPCREALEIAIEALKSGNEKQKAAAITLDYVLGQSGMLDGEPEMVADGLPECLDEWVFG